jgi:hypothetical protein
MAGAFFRFSTPGISCSEKVFLVVELSFGKLGAGEVYSTTRFRRADNDGLRENLIDKKCRLEETFFHLGNMGL